MLHTPKEDETLYLYLAVSKVAVSDVLLQEEQRFIVHPPFFSIISFGLGAASTIARATASSCDALCATKSTWCLFCILSWLEDYPKKFLVISLTFFSWRRNE